MNTAELFEILKEKAEAARPDLSAGFSAVGLVDLTGSDAAQWSLTAAEGRLALTQGAPAGQPDITVTLAAETAAGLYLKTINPMAAFLTGKIKVKGDPAKIALIKKLLTPKG
jgi:putative sterol carrier protein